MFGTYLWKSWHWGRLCLSICRFLCKLIIPKTVALTRSHNEKRSRFFFLRHLIDRQNRHHCQGWILLFELNNTVPVVKKLISYWNPASHLAAPSRVTRNNQMRLSNAGGAAAGYTNGHGGDTTGRRGAENVPPPQPQPPPPQPNSRVTQQVNHYIRYLIIELHQSKED